MQNFLADKNPFGLQMPPKWWLEALHVFDADLVVMTSAMHPVYRLCRRARFSGGPKPMVQGGLVAPHPDTVRMANYKLLPITTIIPQAHWSNNIFAELARRDIWRQGGAKRAADRLEQQDEAQQQQQRKDRHAECDARSHDAYNSYKFRTGERISMAYEQRPAAPKQQTSRPRLPKQMSGPTIIMPGQPTPRSSERAPLVIAAT